MQTKFKLIALTVFSLLMFNVHGSNTHQDGTPLADFIKTKLLSQKIESPYEAEREIYMEVATDAMKHNTALKERFGNWAEFFSLTDKELFTALYALRHNADPESLTAALKQWQAFPADIKEVLLNNADKTYESMNYDPSEIAHAISALGSDKVEELTLEHQDVLSQMKKLGHEGHKGNIYYEQYKLCLGHILSSTLSMIKYIKNEKIVFPKELKIASAKTASTPVTKMLVGSSEDEGDNNK